MDDTRKRVIDLTRDASPHKSDHSDRTPLERVKRLKRRLDAVDAHGDLRSIAKMRDVLKGVLDLLEDEL